jgi:hypothetical protein
LNNIAAVGNTNVLNLFTPNLPANNAMAINMGVNTTAGNNAFIVYTYRGSGATNNALSLSVGNASYTMTALGQHLFGNGTTTTVLDDSSGNATIPGTLTVTGNTIKNSAGNSLSLPTGPGIVALTSNYFMGGNASQTGGLISWTPYAQRGITNS